MSWHTRLLDGWWWIMGERPVSADREDYRAMALLDPPPIVPPPPAPVFILAPGETAILLQAPDGHIEREVHSHTLLLEDPPLEWAAGGTVYQLRSADGQLFIYQREA